VTPPVTAPVVHLVGAGPGDPLLLTRRAARLLAEADVVVLDRRSLDAIAALAPPRAERVFVGRVDGHLAWDTDRIADLLADRARSGDGPAPTVVRLKSGDPFVCSRGGEEMAALVARGIHVEVTPGVTAATAAPLAVPGGMPRGRTVTILAGNHDPVYPPTDVGALADPDGSLVVLVGRSRQAAIADALVAAGLDPHTPAAVVHAATWPGVRVVRTTLGEVGIHRLPPPATVVIGPHRAHT
jgi:uroporphyrin-III C-methyltransferase